MYNKVVFNYVFLQFFKFLFFDTGIYYLCWHFLKKKLSYLITDILFTFIIVMKFVALFCNEMKIFFIDMLNVVQCYFTDAELTCWRTLRLGNLNAFYFDVAFAYLRVIMFLFSFSFYFMLFFCSSVSVRLL